MEPFSFELDNIVSSYPSGVGEEAGEVVRINRRNATITRVEMLLIAKSLGPEKIASMFDAHRKLVSSVDAECEKAWNLFQMQASGCQEERKLRNHLHPLFKLFVVPPWKDKRNYDVLQASVHLDCWNAFCLSEEFEFIQQHSRLNPVSGDCFQSCYESVMYMKALPGASFSLGVTLDAVRTNLAEWICSTEHPNSESLWLPVMQSGPVSFLASDFLCGVNLPLHDHIFKARVVWECQFALHAYIASSGPCSPDSLHIILLFLFAYPSLAVCPRKAEKSAINCFEIQPVNTPQDIRIVMTIERFTGRAKMNLSFGERNPVFQWENWINAAMGLMAGLNQRQKTKVEESGYKFNGPLDMIKRVDLSNSILMLTPYHSQLENLPASVMIWTGWPLFDLRVCQFEKNQLMDAYGPLQGDDFDKKLEYRSRISKVDRILTTIASWNRT